MANSIGELSVLLDAITQPFTSKMGDAVKVAENTARDIEKSTSGMAGGFNLATAAVGGFVGGLVVAVVDKFVNSIGDLATSVIKAGAAAETSQVAFKTLLGSAAGAEQMLKGLQQFAASTPFEFEDLQKSARNMLAFGFSAEQILPMLRKVGDAVSALGGGCLLYTSPSPRDS